MHLFIFIIIFILAGVIQYLQFTLGNSSGLDAVTWNIDIEDAQAGAGMAAYLKDAFVVAYGLAWPCFILFVKSTNQINSWFKSYLIWFTLFVSLLIISHFVNENHDIFLISGARWLLLFHCSVGMAYCFRVLTLTRTTAKIIFVIFVILGGFNIIIALQQAAYFESIYGVGIGASRTTGLFTNAAISGFLGLTLVFIAVYDENFTRSNKFIIIFIGFLTAILSGTRFLVIVNFLIFLNYIYELMTDRFGILRARRIVVASIAPLMLISITLYALLISLIDRGGIFEEAFAEDGRFGRLMFGFDRLFDAGFYSLFFGGGLGMGTNTSATLAILKGVHAERSPLNILVDNGFLTMILQGGLVGGLIFFVGIYILFYKLSFSKKIDSTKIFFLVFIFIITMFAGNPFDHYFLMLGFAAAVGSIMRGKSTFSNI